WQLQLVQLPYSTLLAVVFAVLGVGLTQLRLVSIVLTAATAGALAGGLARPLGRPAAALAAIAFATSPLALYYGRLGFGEALAGACLTLGTVLIVVDTSRPRASGLVGGLLMALAIGTRQNTAFGVVGCLLGAAICGGALDRRARLRIGMAVAAIAVLAVGWLVLVWLPNRDAVSHVVGDILPAVTVPHSLAAIGTAIRRFLRYDDGLVQIVAPLAIATAASLLVLAARWRHVGSERLRLMGAAVGWAVAVLGIMAIVPYNPNRYALPAVPALAIAIGVGTSGALEWIRGPRRPPSATPPVAPTHGHATGARTRRVLAGSVVAVAALAIASSGLLAFAGWVSSGRTALPAIQAAYAAVVPPGSVVAGGSGPTFLMSDRVQALIVEIGTVPVNAGDLYAQAGARWWVVTPDDRPEVATSHPAAWAARQQIRCDPWGPQTLCLYRLP
ncbi:MAG TPA: glycosyltransferase family 39 protein, partial [Candidatus Binatus sp.]|nr:glycosyltransferase family 39 protein [Candidatus Binatus sp.]